MPMLIRTQLGRHMPMLITQLGRHMHMLIRVHN
jgi:hypothetical protein